MKPHITPERKMVFGGGAGVEPDCGRSTPQTLIEPPSLGFTSQRHQAFTVIDKRPRREGVLDLNHTRSVDRHSS